MELYRIDAEGAIYYVDGEGKPLAEVTIPVSDGVANIEHTFVDDALCGKGIAAKLVEDAVALIRENGYKARLDCPYAQKWFQEHPENYDLLYWSCDSNRID